MSKPTEIRRAAVIGAGTMGGGIAMCFANAGIPVTIVETDSEALDRGLDTVARNYRSAAARGGLARGRGRAPHRACMRGTTDLAAVADADIVIEAVFEDMASRSRCSPSSTASPSRARCSRPTPPISTSMRSRAVTARPDAVVGMHFFSPANVMRLLEVVRGADDLAGGARDRDRGRAQDRQDPGGGRRLPRLRRQPHAPRPLGRGRAPAARRRAAAGRSTRR